MGLVGNSSELSLLDLIQVKGQTPTPCRILVHGRSGAGYLFLDAGVVVYAEYAGLLGEAAAHAMLAEDLVGYRVTSEMTAPQPNMGVEHRTLLLQAAVRKDELRRGARPAVRPPSVPDAGRPLVRAAPRPAAPARVGAAPAPTARQPVSPARGDDPSQRAAVPERPAPLPPAPLPPLPLPLQVPPAADLADRPAPPSPAPPSPPGTRLPRRIATLAGSLVVGIALAGVATAVFGSVSVHRPEVAAAPAPAAPPVRLAPPAPLEASALTGPRDALPVLLSGEPPRSPAPELALRPTVVLRLLVDETGRVARSDVYQARPDRASFEQAALAAASGFTFRPAQRDGAPVPVWIDWPVDFL